MCVVTRLCTLAAVFWLSACQAPTASPTPPPPPTPACTEPGSVLRARAEAPTRGYAYSYEIYLPPCYEARTDQAYPVLYLLPGRGSGPGAWFAAGADQAADSAIHSGAVPPFIIVTTESTDGDPQAEVIFNDLVPAIERQYRVLADREHRSVAGASLGGSGAYRLVFGHPETFASAGLFGAGLISGEEAQFQAWLAALPAGNRPRVFLNCGFGDPLMLERAQVMAGMLDEAGLAATTVFSEGEHDYGYWVANLPAYFEWVAEDW